MTSIGLALNRIQSGCRFHLRLLLGMFRATQFVFGASRLVRVM